MKSLETPSAFDRLPPHDLNAEACVLASMMLDMAMIPGIREAISRDAFYSLDHQIIFDAVCACYDRGGKVDGVLVQAELDRRKLLEDVGGLRYLAEIYSSVPSPAHGLHYAGIVREKWTLRELVALSNDLQRNAYAPAASDNSIDIAEGAMTRLARMAEKTRTKPLTQSIGEMLAETVDQLGRGGIELVTTGFRDLDDVLRGGLALGEMWLIGGRPSMGKSTLAKQMGVRIAVAGVPTAIFSLEEKNPKIARNILSAETRIDNNVLRQESNLSKENWDEIYAATKRLGNVPLYCCDSLRDIRRIRAEASMLVQQKGVRVLIVDYLQRVQAGGENKYERAGNASEGMSDLVKDLNCVGICPVQLNRGNLQRGDDNRPTMADLRDSGQIEQDADGIIFLHREDYYHSDQQDYQPTGQAELMIAKNRDGIRNKTVILTSNLRYQTFDDLTEADDHQAAPPEERRAGRAPSKPKPMTATEAKDVVRILCTRFPGRVLDFQLRTWARDLQPFTFAAAKAAVERTKEKTGSRTSPRCCSRSRPARPAESDDPLHRPSSPRDVSRAGRRAGDRPAAQGAQDAAEGVRASLYRGEGAGGDRAGGRASSR